ncbi:hypothetical protein N7922_25220 (plasmid) [Kosakonia sp. ML.JS2a]|uniref:hypothetical protein n=1 Tax=Kosakonia sp. ML.JS2a TaxID=2980557 RepID=UPI0021D9319A|nr:hypothetical protein [Kosakonia sp. ML.JS2a]UXY13539.1 hypothetical protein N7922_25220 [Kosakonia sp. ML.JS2a]
MNRKHREVESRWLTSRQPSQRTGYEALKFADECWAGGLRMSASQPASSLRPGDGQHLLVPDPLRETWGYLPE